MTKVELDPAGTLWIAGLCGQVWERTSTNPTVWVEHKTQTGGHVWGMQFPSHDRGYVVGMGGELNQCIVRLNR